MTIVQTERLTKVYGKGEAAVTALDGVGLLFGVAAALIPARQAAKLDIVTALHYE